jgi:hypothetical protein
VYRILKPLLFAAMILILVGCGGEAADQSANESSEGETLGGVTLTHPPDGAVVYSSVLNVGGGADANAPDSLLVRVVNLDGEMIAETATAVEDGVWDLELVHGYSGDPTEAIVEVRPASDPDSGVYASAEIVLSSLPHRPEGVSGSIDSPPEGVEMGGDVLPVSGRVSGVNDFIVELVGSDGTVLDSQTVALRGAYEINDLPWAVDLTTQDYTGSALIRATFAEDIEVIRPIVLTSAAG